MAFGHWHRLKNPNDPRSYPRSLPYLFRNPGDAGPAILHQPREQAPRTDSRKGIITTESSSRRVKTGGHDAEGVTVINFGGSVLGRIKNEER